MGTIKAGAKVNSLVLFLAIVVSNRTHIVYHYFTIYLPQIVVNVGLYTNFTLGWKIVYRHFSVICL